MAGLEVRDFSAPDETRAPDKTKIDIVRMGGASAARMSLEPGWRWSECIKPVAGTDSCQAHHVGVLLSGTLHVAHQDGSEQDIGAGRGTTRGSSATRRWSVTSSTRGRRRITRRVRRSQGKEVRKGTLPGRKRPLGPRPASLRKRLPDLFRDIGRIPACSVPRMAGMP
jgi:hypothetical protein